MCDRLLRPISPDLRGKALIMVLGFLAFTGAAQAQLTDTALAVGANAAIPPLSAAVPQVASPTTADPFSSLRSPAKTAAPPAAAPDVNRTSVPAPATLPVPPPVVPAPNEATSAPQGDAEDAVPAYVVPGQDTLQTAAALDGLITLEGYYARLETARQERERKRLLFEAETLKARQEKEALISGVVPGAANRTVPRVAPPVQPYVNSIYRLGDTAYAEMWLGTNQVVAKAGTILLNGERVLSIGESSVTLTGAKGMRVLPIRGSAEMASQ